MPIRITTEKWLEGKNSPYRLTAGDNSWEGMSNKASGIINDGMTVLIVPVTDAARQDLLINHGLDYDFDVNYNFFATTNSVDKTTMRSCNNLRMTTNNEDLVFINGAWFDSKLIRGVNKHYKRLTDDIVFYGGAQNGLPNIIRMELPCQDWVAFIAPRTELKDKSSVSFNPITGEWE
jgi:hypothetical protein